MSRLGVVVNPTAGRGRGTGLGSHATSLLRSRGHDVIDLSAGTIAEATRNARREILAGVDALVVVGGDGMVHLGANVVAGTALPLGIVAGGTGNDIARSLGLPRHEVRASVQAIEHGLVHGARPIDAVHVSTPEGDGVEWYLGALSCGVDAAVNARANELTWPQGGGRYVRALGSVLRSLRPYGFRVTHDAGVWESAGTVVAVANAPLFGGGMRIAPDASMDDGLIDVVVAGPLSRSGVVRVFPRIYSGRHVEHPAVQVFRTRSVLIEPTGLGAAPPLAFADGEPVAMLPLRADVRAGAVHVLA
ncbi:diacylglycerol kinase family protein [Cellulomonas sp. P24]|uniref:diacylglycerol/lipid kinase family protein n=1 Tax=Cellulomonas sp. P24 TaxID=2885206 RepID=UPI00216B1214|nr:diacylglycerol kinase family protein [Cellulomonas sp. P24]MCR6494646.1 diacylglycerol kinase family lipid kinase [Cellulomonas sp. P24]